MTLDLGSGSWLHMPPEGPVYRADSHFLPAPHHAGLLLEYARQRGLEPAAAVRRASSPELISPSGLSDLLVEVVRADRAPDTAYLLGQAWWPGHAGAASHALAHAANLGDALQLIVRHGATLSPLLTPRCLVGPRQTIIYWMDACGSPARRNLLVDLHFSALVAMSRWLSGEHVPWTACLNRPKPADTAHLELHVGSSLRFDCQLDALLIDSHWLHRPWPRGQGMAAEAARRGAQAPGSGPTRSLLAALYDHLMCHLARSVADTGDRPAPTLDQAAAVFETSTATFKRLLARHGTHFQAELDLVRTHLAMHLFLHHGLANDAVALRLGFHDSTNFRRSFKRWTGMTPSVLRSVLGPLGA